jgi:hypothetical protein
VLVLPTKATNINTIMCFFISALVHFLYEASVTNATFQKDFHSMDASWQLGIGVIAPSMGCMGFWV